MKNQLNTQLKSVLSSEKIVYVFGSGISSALSGYRSSWYQWIADGIEYISDKALATELKDHMESESSAESLDPLQLLQDSRYSLDKQRFINVMKKVELVHPKTRRKHYQLPKTCATGTDPSHSGSPAPVPPRSGWFLTAGRLPAGKACHLRFPLPHG
jgi:hypothetical protein